MSPHRGRLKRQVTRLEEAAMPELGDVFQPVIVAKVARRKEKQST